MEWTLKVTIYRDVCTLILDCHLDCYHKVRSVPVNCTFAQAQKAMEAYKSGALNVMPTKRLAAIADEALSRALRAAATGK